MALHIQEDWIRIPLHDEVNRVVMVGKVGCYGIYGNYCHVFVSCIVAA